MSADQYEARRMDDLQPPSPLTNAWSRYWALGAPHSCVGSYGECYGGAIGAFWRTVFAGIPAKARLLDIATGNGALPRLLVQDHRAANVQCDAVDLAVIYPTWLIAAEPVDQARIRFYGGVDAAKLPFGDRCFDLIVSQYGLEYTNLDGTLPELLRVRASGGGIALVLHHTEGRPASLAAVEIEHLDWLMRGGGLFDAAAVMVEPMARAHTAQGRASLQGQPQANTARQRFNMVLGELSARAASGDGADVLVDARDAVMSLLANAGREGVMRASANLAALRQEFSGSATRLHDLCAHALGVDAAMSLRERLAAALGRPVSLGELHEQQHLMGWTIQAPFSH